MQVWPWLKEMLQEEDGFQRPVGVITIEQGVSEEEDTVSAEDKDLEEIEGPPPPAEDDNDEDDNEVPYICPFGTYLHMYVHRLVIAQFAWSLGLRVERNAWLPCAVAICFVEFALIVGWQEASLVPSVRNAMHRQNVPTFAYFIAVNWLH
jgi:hypothetical protein